jgi:hypothetical protein
VNTPEGLRLPRPTNCSDELWTLIESCWERLPQDRPTFLSVTKQLKGILNIIDLTEQERRVEHHLSTCYDKSPLMYALSAADSAEKQRDCASHPTNIQPNPNSTRGLRWSAKKPQNTTTASTPRSEQTPSKRTTSRTTQKQAFHEISAESRRVPSTLQIPSKGKLPDTFGKLSLLYTLQREKCQARCPTRPSRDSTMPIRPKSKTRSTSSWKRVRTRWTTR